MNAAALALAFVVAAHSRSEGRVKFKLDDTGRIDARITLSTLDMPELCDVDLSASDSAVRAERVRVLDTCVRRELPVLMRVRADVGAAQPAACPLVVEQMEIVKTTVAIDAMASCPSFPDGRVLVDWGLFAGQPLDHVAVTTFEQPHAEPKLMMLSKRSSKLVIEIARPLWPRLAGAALVVVIVGALAALAALVVRRRRRRAAPP